MRIKYLIPAVVTAAALTLTSCSGSSLPDSVDTDGLDGDQKSVVEVWYDASGDSGRKRIEKMSATDIKVAVSGFALLCLVGEEQAAAHLTTGPNGLDEEGAERLADAIDDHLCDSKHRPATKSTSKNASPLPGAKDKTLNPTHDLDLPTSRYDREEATLRAPANPKPPVSRTQSSFSSGKR